MATRDLDDLVSTRTTHARVILYDLLIESPSCTEATRFLQPRDGFAGKKEKVIWEGQADILREHMSLPDTLSRSAMLRSNQASWQDMSLPYASYGAKCCCCMLADASCLLHIAGEGILSSTRWSATVLPKFAKRGP